MTAPEATYATFPELEEHLRALVGDAPDEPIREAADRIRRNAWERSALQGDHCGVCCKLFADGDVLHRVSELVGDGLGWYPRMRVRCQDCAPPGLRGMVEAPCDGCGRVVARTEDRRRRAFVTCSDRCYERARRPKPAARECEDCGVSFAPARADARYCSSPCRQRSYRRRVRGAAH